VTHFLLRLVIMPIGIGFAALAAFVVGLVGALSSGHENAFAGFAAATWLSVVLAGLSGADPAELAAFLGLLWLLLVAILLVPIALVALIGELIGSTSWFAYAFGMGAAFAAVPVLFPGDPATHGWPAGASLGFFATGLVAGTAYWFVAGRSAARSRPRRGAGPPSSGIDHA
jgi:hypothetical protein